jgi:pSer/pThr/pTyr-binding forkhead associated (FHA) protein
VDAAKVQSQLSTAIAEFRSKHDAFDKAYRSYTDQYGDRSVRSYESYKISGTIDPVIIILGRTTPLLYRDSRRLISGSIGSLTIQRRDFYIFGRREPSDSKLIGWSSREEIELEHYDSRVSVIPSRIHAAIFTDENEVYFSDLGSTSGSIVAGESLKPEPFITLYGTSTVDVHKITIDTKYAHKKP